NEATAEAWQADPNATRPTQSLDSERGLSPPQMQAESSQHKDFGQPVVSEPPSSLDDGYRAEGLLTPAQAAPRFQIPGYLLRKACAEGRLEHLRVVNAIWLSPSGVAAFAHWRRAQQRGDS